MEELISAIQDKYSFTLPDVYRILVERGHTNHANEDMYLWLPETRWLSLERILEHEPADYHQDDFVPFAKNPAGDYWMWRPDATRDGRVPVVFCPHDDELGEFDSPDITGFLYRRVLLYALSEYEDAGDAEARAQMREFASVLQSILPPAWIERIVDIAGRPAVAYNQKTIFAEEVIGLLTEDQLDAIVEEDLKFADLGVEFKWMK